MASDPVDWTMAERVAVRVANRSNPEVDANTSRRMERDFAEATPVAEGLVGQTTGLTSLSGPATAEVTDRAGWVRANIASFRRLLGPLFEKEGGPGGIISSLPGPFGAATRAIAGAELGAVLGWMSTRVLGQYDLLLTEDADAAGDTVYYVGPNILSLERRHGFAPEEFRLWIAIHELTHRAQFTGVPWMRAHFLGLVDQGISFAASDPKLLLGSIQRVASEIRAGRNPIAEAGLAGALATPEQAVALRQIQALMSLLEGHGDVTMNAAAADRIPGARRFADTLQARRDSVRGVARFVQQLIGLEAKMRQYRDGERFCEDVMARGGDALFSLVWDGPEFLPTVEEVRDPARWVARVGGRSLEIA